MARISYTEKEVELLARLIKSEALGEGEEGMLLVGNVVVNRVVANCDIFRNVRWSNLSNKSICWRRTTPF